MWIQRTASLARPNSRCVLPGLHGQLTSKNQCLWPKLTENCQATLVVSRLMSTEANGLIFRQLFEPVSCTYTYLLADAKSRKAIVIDPVLLEADRDANLIRELELDLIYAANTHVHADHITGTGKLKQVFPSSKSILSIHSGAKSDVKVKHGEVIDVGTLKIEVRATPGHTNGCLTYVHHDSKRAFTGDALLIRGCGRTDFQQGDSGLLYDSIHKQILSLPDDFSLYPAHDYKGLTVTTVLEERRYNARVNKSKEEYIKIMANLNLPYPRMIDVALPANLVCGLGELPPELDFTKK